MNLIHPLIIFSVDSPVAFDLETRLRHEFVRDVLRRHGLTFVEGVGKATTGGGSCERPLCIAFAHNFVVWDDSVSAQDIVLGIASQFDQASVLCVDANRIAYHVLTDGDRTESVGVFRQVPPYKAETARNYTFVNGVYYVTD